MNSFLVKLQQVCVSVGRNVTWYVQPQRFGHVERMNKQQLTLRYALKFGHVENVWGQLTKRETYSGFIEDLHVSKTHLVHNLYADVLFTWRTTFLTFCVSQVRFSHGKMISIPIQSRFRFTCLRRNDAPMFYFWSKKDVATKFVVFAYLGRIVCMWNQCGFSEHFNP